MADTDARQIAAASAEFDNIRDTSMIILSKTADAR
jgi:hypothetical protein